MRSLSGLCNGRNIKNSRAAEHSGFRPAVHPPWASIQYAYRAKSVQLHADQLYESSDMRRHPVLPRCAVYLSRFPRILASRYTAGVYDGINGFGWTGYADVNFRWHD